jgi:hypothetical protein
MCRNVEPRTNSMKTSPRRPKRAIRLKKPRLSENRMEDLSRRCEAMAELLASEARQRQDVQQFRARYLPDGLLPLDLPAVTNWLKARSQHQIEAPQPGFRGGSVLFVEAGTFRISRVPALSPELTVLADLVKALCHEFRWRDWEAVYFVLCDYAPSYRPMETSALPNMNRPGLSTVSIVLDLTMSPREVAAEYAAFRANLLGPKNRVKTLGSRAYQLVDVCSRCDWDIAQAIEQWNARYPDKAIATSEQRKFFKRDALAARQRLLGSKFSMETIYSPPPEPAQAAFERYLAQARPKRGIRPKMAWEE